MQLNGVTLEDLAPVSAKQIIRKLREREAGKSVPPQVAQVRIEAETQLRNQRLDLIRKVS